MLLDNHVGPGSTRGLTCQVFWYKVLVKKYLESFFGSFVYQPAVGTLAQVALHSESPGADRLPSRNSQIIRMVSLHVMAIGV